MARAKKVYLASDNSEHETAEAANHHERHLKLEALAGLTVHEIVAGIDADDSSIREAIVVANNLVQEVRRARGEVRRRSAPAAQKAA